MLTWPPGRRPCTVAAPRHPATWTYSLMTIYHGSIVTWSPTGGPASQPGPHFPAAGPAEQGTPGEKLQVKNRSVDVEVDLFPV